jgi:TRAP-type C4-dicarboxylate transport system substrate-binding protein
MFTNRIFNLLIIVAVLAVTVTACAPQIAMTSTPVQDQSITLRFAVADKEGSPSEPYVLEFIEQVKTLSNGDITIEPAWWAAGDSAAGFETGVIQLVKEGKFDLGLAASRAFDNEDITSFQALQAPFLIDNDALSKAVAASDIANRMMENLSSAGIVGFTLWPEDLRHPFSLVPGKPFLSPEDFAGLNIRATRSTITYTLIETLGGIPMFGDDGYEGAESGLRQGASLTGTPIASGNVTFFAKFQVLFANAASMEKLSEEQRSVLRQAAAAIQKKAIAEHPSDAEAGAAWCADGGSVVLANAEQVAAFEAAAQPIFEQIEQEPANAELIVAIRELKAKTTSSPGAEACKPATFDQGNIPSELIGLWSFTAFGDSWTVKLTADGTFSLYAPDGKLDVGGSYEVIGSEAVFRDETRGTGTLCVPAEGRYQWELTGDRLLFTVIEDKCTVGRIKQWTAGWQKVEEKWSTGLPPNGVWQVELTSDDFLRMGVNRAAAADWVGVYTTKYQDGRSIEDFEGALRTTHCEADLEVVGDVVRETYTSSNPPRVCIDPVVVMELQWRLDSDGLHLRLVSITEAPFLENAAVLEAKPWQKIADQ